MDNKCELCNLIVNTRKHHLIPKSKGGKTTIDCCETCENFLHKTWSHNELRDTYNNVKTILADVKFQKFLKWRLKQPPITVFHSDIGKFRNRKKYS
jgi:hypothetical protein